MNNKILTNTDIYEIINPILNLDLTVVDLRLLANVLLDEAAVFEEEEYRKETLESFGDFLNDLFCIAFLQDYQEDPYHISYQVFLSILHDILSLFLNKKDFLDLL